ncbi:MAG: hypothetical protein QOJ50_2543 [Cryptosporangiaceae bacterium]|nr:hypothetical protein [Cryptosporangiaceae bacterium]
MAGSALERSGEARESKVPRSQSRTRVVRVRGPGVSAATEGWPREVPAGAPRVVAPSDTPAAPRPRARHRTREAPAACRPWAPHREPGSAPHPQAPTSSCCRSSPRPQAPHQPPAARSVQRPRTAGSWRTVTSPRLGESGARRRGEIRHNCPQRWRGAVSGGRVLGIVRPRRDNRKRRQPDGTRHGRAGVLPFWHGVRPCASVELHDSTAPDARRRRSQAARRAGSESIKSARHHPSDGTASLHGCLEQTVGTSGNASAAAKSRWDATASPDCGKRGAVRGRPPPGGWAGAVGVRLRGGRAEPTR